MSEQVLKAEAGQHNLMDYAETYNNFDWEEAKKHSLGMKRAK